MKTEVRIEYCSVWNYAPKAVSLAAKILDLGDRIASLTLIPSSGGAFEVGANGKLLHSKLESGEWPDFDALVSQIKKTKTWRLLTKAGTQEKNPEGELWRRSSSSRLFSALQFPFLQFLLSCFPEKFFLPESEGCLVALAIFKIVVGP